MAASIEVVRRRSRLRARALACLRCIVALALATVALAAGSAPHEPRPEDEAPLDPMVVRSLRERLAAGSVREAMTALAEIKEAPHGRHGLLLYEAMVRAELRIESCDRRRPELDEERATVAAELKSERASTSTSVVRRLNERLGALDRELTELAAQRTIEAQLREVCAQAWQEIAPRLSPASADGLADDLLMRLVEERRPGSRCLLVEMAGAVPSPKVVPTLVEHVGEKGETAELIVTALVALGRRGEASATPAVIPCLAHPDWRVQAEAVEALRRFHRRTSIPFLIESLTRAQGRMKDDLGFALRSLTGERFVADPAIWKRWWDEHQSDFTMPAAPAAKPTIPQDGEGGTQFFGVGSYSKRVVFVLDISGSMDEPMGGTDRRRTKLEVARSHLKAAIAGLASDTWFDVLVYANQVEACFPTVQPADDEHRTAALDFVSGLVSRSGTNIHGALLEAFRIAELEPGGRAGAASRGSASSRAPAVDTIFFLTDGFPTSGLVRVPQQILREIAGLNQTRRIRIHSVGIGEHDRAFLELLAATSGGTYAAR